MKVLLVACPKYWRGGEAQIAGIALHLKKTDISPVLLCAKESELEKFCIINTINHVVFNNKGLLDISLAQKIKEVVKQEKIDIIHANDSHAIAATAIAYHCLGVKKPVILSRRIMTPIHNNWFSKFKYNHSGVVKIICDSKADLGGLAPAIKQKSLLTVVYPFVDIEKFYNKNRNSILRNDFNIKDNEILVGNVSALSECKDIITNIEVAQILHNNVDFRFKFIVIGIGEELDALKKNVIQKQLEGCFFFAGFRKNIADILPDFDIFLLTSQSEGLGLVLIEAQASGIPIVSTSVGGIPEIITDRENGLLAPSKDALALSNAVMELVKNKKLRNEVIQNAKRTSKHFAPQETMQKIVEIYLQALKNENR